MRVFASPISSWLTAFASSSFRTTSAANAVLASSSSILNRRPRVGGQFEQQRWKPKGGGGSRHTTHLRDLIDAGPKVPEGSEGEKHYQLEEEFTTTRKMLETFPTLETHKETFFGKPFEEIPVCLIRCSKNNTKIAFNDWRGEQICYTSSTQEGFKNAKKKSTVAGQATGVAGALRALRRGVDTVKVQIKGLGPGRLSAVKGLTLGGLNVVCIQDITPLPEMGPRPKKARRL